MKKISCMVLVAVLTAVMLTACGGNNTSAEAEEIVSRASAGGPAVEIIGISAFAHGRSKEIKRCS